jgi:2-polyprenyl-3-methyl-5-hydroxy-6-metoxy-1,4-benzoquinol methylase
MTSQQIQTTERQAHWESVYRSKQDAEVSWFQNEPQPSLDLIRQFAPISAKVIDIGGGSSILASRLMTDGYRVSVLDISASALERAKARNADFGSEIEWIHGDITEIKNLGSFDVWHDRAVFHFLTDPKDRMRYVELAMKTVRPGGFLVIGAFALDGPEKCSGLNVQRYDARSLSDRFQPPFELVECRLEPHQTPWGKSQAFCFAVLRRNAS